MVTYALAIYKKGKIEDNAGLAGFFPAFEHVPCAPEGR
jgi:hypothetical protein